MLLSEIVSEIERHQYVQQCITHDRCRVFRKENDWLILDPERKTVIFGSAKMTYDGAGAMLRRPEERISVDWSLWTDPRKIKNPNAT